MTTIHTVKKLSSGNPFIDAVLNGGFALSSIVLVIEDTPTKLYQQFIKYVIAEGLVNNNTVFFYPPTQLVNECVINNLPYQSTQVDAILNSKTTETTSASVNAGTSSQQEMKIAWRYENINYTNLISQISKQLKYIFDLSRPLQDKLYNKSQLHSTIINNIEHPYKQLNDILTQFINQYQNIAVDYTEEDTDKYTRLVIPNLFSNLNMKELTQLDVDAINTAIHNVKNITRCVNGFTFITVNEATMPKWVLNRLINVSDYVLKVKSLLMVSDKEKVGEYDAILHVEKVPRISSLKGLDIETDMYGVLRDKRKIIIEKIDIGVEVDRNTKVKESDIEYNKAINSGASGKNKFDF